jgi:predicted lipid-binding transport protein (Tim44 family)
MENNSFEYTYSAQRQQEVEEIRKAYLPKEKDKMEQLRKLHAIPTQKAQAVSLAAGIMGALILGTGMSLCMTELGAALGTLSVVLGILVGLIGMVLIALAYPAYSSTLKKEREKIAPDILQLTDELMK